MLFELLPQDIDYLDPATQMMTAQHNESIVIVQRQTGLVQSIIQVPFIQSYIIFKQLVYVLQSFAKQCQITVYDIITGLPRDTYQIDCKAQFAQFVLGDNLIFCFVLDQDSEMRLLKFAPKLQILKLKVLPKDKPQKLTKPQVLYSDNALYVLHQNQIFCWKTDFAKAEAALFKTSQNQQFKFLLSSNGEIFVDTGTILEGIKLQLSPIKTAFVISSDSVVYRGRQFRFEDSQRAAYSCYLYSQCGYFQFNEFADGCYAVSNNLGQQMVVNQTICEIDDKEFQKPSILGTVTDFWYDEAKEIVHFIGQNDEFGYEHVNSEGQQLQTFTSKPLMRVISEQLAFAVDNALNYQSRQITLMAHKLVDFDVNQLTIGVIYDIGVAIYQDSTLVKLITNGFNYQTINILTNNMILLLSSSITSLIILTEFGTIQKDFCPIRFSAGGKLQLKNNKLIFSNQTPDQPINIVLEQYIEFMSCLLLKENLSKLLVPFQIQNVSYSELLFIRKSLANEPTEQIVDCFAHLLFASQSADVLLFCLENFGMNDSLSKNKFFIDLLFPLLVSLDNANFYRIVQTIVNTQKSNKLFKPLQEPLSKITIGDVDCVYDESFFNRLIIILRKQNQVDKLIITLRLKGGTDYYVVQQLNQMRDFILQDKSIDQKLLAGYLKNILTGNKIFANNPSVEQFVNISVLLFQLFDLKVLNDKQQLHIQNTTGFCKLNNTSYRKLINNLPLMESHYQSQVQIGKSPGILTDERMERDLQQYQLLFQTTISKYTNTKSKVATKSSQNDLINMKLNDQAPIPQSMVSQFVPSQPMQTQAKPPAQQIGTKIQDDLFGDMMSQPIRSVTPPNPQPQIEKLVVHEPIIVQQPVPEPVQEPEIKQPAFDFTAFLHQSGTDEPQLAPATFDTPVVQKPTTGGFDFANFLPGKPQITGTEIAFERPSELPEQKQAENWAGADSWGAAQDSSWGVSQQKAPEQPYQAPTDLLDF